MTVTDAAGNELTSITLNPRASQTWTADQLGIAEPGSGVVATAQWGTLDPEKLETAQICELVDEVEAERGSPKDTGDALSSHAANYADMVKVVQNGFTYAEGTDYLWSAIEDTLYVDWGPQGAEPAAGAEYTVYVYECVEPRIAGVEKHTVGTAGARTSSATEMVDGYTAIPDDDVWMAENGGAYLEGQSRWVVPIVQTNNGWNTEIFITNISGRNNSVTATFYAAAGQGVAGESEMLLSGEVLAAGETVRVNLLDYGFPEGVVGSLWIDATHAVVAEAFRHKVETGMMLTTNAQPRVDYVEESGPFERYGPLVFRDYNGWNTGINIANLSSEDNQVSVTYYNYAGNVVAAETRTIPARAMEYVYTPATGNFGVGENQITAVRITGQYPLAAAIDEVKYLGGQGQGHAMSYAAMGWLDAYAVADPDDPLNPIPSDGRYAYETLLALPLVQKGNALTGTGDTSGINLFNPGEYSVEAWVQFVSTSGVPVAPTVSADDAEAPLVLPMAAGAGVTIYTLNYSEMPAGFQGSAIVGVVNHDWRDTESTLVGVSNNVNYDVAGDGSAVYNMVAAYLYYAFFDW